MKLTPEQEKKLTEAASSLRHSPGFAPIEAHLKAELEEIKNLLVHNTSVTTVPSLQGRAQQLLKVIELLNRKTQ